MASTASSADSNGVLSSLIGRAPQYKDGHDAVMFALHTHLLRRGLVCHALSPQPNAAQSSAQQPRELPYVPPGWNASDDSYSFTYHSPNAPGATIVVKGVKMGSSLIIHAIRQQQRAEGGAKDAAPVSVDINVADYVNTDASLSDYRALYKDLGGLLLLFDSQIAARVVPPPPAASTHAASAQQAFDSRDPLRVPPGRPVLADEDDDSRLRDPRLRPRGDFDDDLNPLGGPGLFGTGSGGGGSLMGPGQFPRGGGRPQQPGGPPGLAPRFDPYGPMPGMSEPDFDELVPPGLPGQGGPRGPFGGPQGFGRGRGGGGGGMFGGGGGGGFGGPFG